MKRPYPPESIIGIPNESHPFNDIHNTYVAFEKGRWDGNDVYWLNVDKCCTLTDFDKASVLGFERAKNLDDRYVVMPFALADKVKRRTFEHRNINKRKMVFGAGLKTPEIVKKYQRRKADPKHRFNCPSCGRITWQDNPYDFMGCRNIDCEEWSVHS